MERLTKVMDKYLKKAAADWDKKKVLTLVVSKEWFDMIAAGRKTEEYREIKPYWVARLFQNNSNIVDVQYLASGLAGRTDLLKGYIDAHRIVPKHTLTSSLSTATARIVHELRRRLRVLQSASQGEAYAPTSGLIPSFSSLSLSSV